MSLLRRALRLGSASLSTSRSRKRRQALQRAVLETLERRQMLTAVPTAVFSHDGPKNEGDLVTFAFSDQADADSTEFTYSYDFDNDGTFEIADSPEASAVHGFTDNGSYTVKGRIADPEGNHTDYTAVVSIANVAPVALLANDGPVVQGSDVTVNFSHAADPSSADIAAGFHYSFALSPSNLASSYTSAGTDDSASFSMSSVGRQAVYGRVFDKDGGYRDYATVVVVNATATPPAVLAPSNLVASVVSAGSVYLSWADHSDNETGYELDYATDADFTDVTHVPVMGSFTDTASHTLSGLTADTLYYFRVRAFDDYDYSDYANLATATPEAVSFVPADASGDDSGGPLGSKLYSLDDGFVVNPYSAFTPATLGNYSFTDTSSPSSSATVEDGQGAASSLATSHTRTLTVVSTLDQDGSWTYSETLTAGWETDATPVISGLGTSASSSIEWSYSFVASGDAASSTYSFVGHWETGSTGSLSGQASGSWSVSGEDDSAFESIFDLIHNTVLVTTSSRSGSTHNSFIASQPYSYGVDGGTIGGFLSHAESYNSAWEYTDTENTYHEDGSYSDSFLGAGAAVVLDSGGGAMVYTLVQNASSGWSYDLNTLSTLNANGTWSEAGSDLGTAYQTSGWSAVGVGTYSTSGEGWSMGGVLGQSNGQDSSNTYVWEYDLDSSGQWQLADGSDEYDWSEHSGDFYSGLGSYSTSNSTETGSSATSGTLRENGHDHYESSIVITGVVDLVGDWSYTGSSSGHYEGSGDSSYDGGGTYSYTADTGPMSGTLTEKGSERWTSSYDWEYHLGSNDQWQLFSSNGANTSHSSDDSCYSGGGGYAYSDDMQSVSGSISESGTDHSSSNYNWTEQLGSDELWHLASGSGSTTGSTQDAWSYRGTGTYVSSDDSGTIEGGISENGGWGSSSQYTISGSVSGGDWVYGGSSTDNYHDSSHWEYAGLGDYSFLCEYGMMEGTQEQSGHQDSSSHYDWVETLGTDGQWHLASGSGQAVGSTQDDWSYDTHGSYSLDGGAITGSLADSGGEGSSSQHTIDSSVVAGAWVDIGSGWREAYAADNWSYVGGGDYWNEGPHGSVITGTIDEHGSQHYFGLDHYEDVLGADGTWSTASGTGGSHVTQEDASSFCGGTDYEDGDLTGSLSENGNDYSWAELYTTRTLGADGLWTETGDGNSNGHGQATRLGSECSYYSRSIDSDLTMDGSTTANYQTSSSYSFNTEGVLNADGTYSFTVSTGHTEQSTQNDFSYDGSGSCSFCDGYEDTQEQTCSGEYTPCTECASWWCSSTYYDHTFDHTFQESYGEGGGHSMAAESGANGACTSTVTDWTLDSAGQWQPCTSTTTEDGYSRACYSFFSGEGESDHTTCDATYDDAWGQHWCSHESGGSDWTSQHSITEAYDYNYHRQTTDGVGSGEGCGWAQGQANYDYTWDSDSDYDTGATWGWETQNEGVHTCDGYNYTEHWTESYADGQTTASGCTSSLSAGGSHESTYHREGQSLDSGNNLHYEGPVDSDVCYGYSETPQSAGFSENWYYGGPTVSGSEYATGGPGLGFGQTPPGVGFIVGSGNQQSSMVLEGSDSLGGTFSDAAIVQDNGDSGEADVGQMQTMAANEGTAVGPFDPLNMIPIKPGYLWYDPQTRQYLEPAPDLMHNNNELPLRQVMDPRFSTADIINAYLEQCERYQAAVQTIESVGTGIGNTIASFNPINTLATVIYGQDASGEKVNWLGGRGLAAATIVTGALGLLAKAAEGAKGIQPVLVKLSKLEFPESRLCAEPWKLARLGKFDISKCDPIEVELTRSGRMIVMNGVTRVTAAMRAGVTELRAYVFRR